MCTAVVCSGVCREDIVQVHHGETTEVNAGGQVRRLWLCVDRRDPDSGQTTPTGGATH